MREFSEHWKFHTQVQLMQLKLTGLFWNDSFKRNKKQEYCPPLMSWPTLNLYREIKAQKIFSFMATGVSRAADNLVSSTAIQSKHRVITWQSTSINPSSTKLLDLSKHEQMQDVSAGLLKGQHGCFQGLKQKKNKKHLTDFFFWSSHIPHLQFVKKKRLRLKVKVKKKEALTLALDSC